MTIAPELVLVGHIRHLSARKLSISPFDTDKKCLTSISRLHSGLLFTPIGERSWVILAPLLAKPPTSGCSLNI
jgi:hypothetical protein